MEKKLDVVTIGDGMVTMNPKSKGPLRFVTEFERRAGGAELNFAIGCARLGLRAGWISRLGRDEFGIYVRNFARGEGVDVSCVELVEGYSTSVNFKEIWEDGSGKTYYYRANSPVLTLHPDELPYNYIRQAKVLHMTGVFAAIRQDDMTIVHRALEFAKQHQVLVSFDPNIRLKLWSAEKAACHLVPLLPYVDIMLAGIEEAELLLGTDDEQQIVERLMDFGIQCIAIKLGEQGSIGSMGGKVVKVPAPKLKVVADSVGAGDGFDAGFIFGFMQGWPLEEILVFSNTVGSMVASVSGDNEGLPYREEVLAKLGRMKIIDR